MGRHRDGETDGFDGGRRTTVIIGAIGVLAIALVFGAWWTLSSYPSIGQGAIAMSTARVTLAELPGATTDAASTETFVVPTPSFSTPTLGVALGSREPEIPGETPAPPLPAGSPTTSSTSSSSTPSSTTTGRSTVSNLSLACNNQGHRVRAILSFMAAGPVSVSVTASNRTENTVASGNVRLDIVGNAPDTGTGTCSAKVNGMAIGPIAAR